MTCVKFITGWLWSWKHDISIAVHISWYICSCLWFFSTSCWLGQGKCLLIHNKSWSAEQLGHVLSAVLPIWCCVTICWMVSAEAQGLQTWPVKCICLWYYIRTTNWEHGTFFCWYCNNGNMLCSDNVSILNNLFDISVTLFALFHYSQLGVQTTNILSRYLCSLQLHQIKCL